MRSLTIVLVCLSLVGCAAAAKDDSKCRSVGSLKSRRGRHTLIHRHYFILNLVGFWHQIGEKAFGARNSRFKVVSTPDSDLEVFCKYVFKAVGWPTGGLRNAISEAASDWLNSHQKHAPLSK